MPDGPRVGSPSLDQLQVFLTVVETGSFAAAGRRLGRATSAISYAIANLEMQLAGVTIFWTVQNINVMRSSYVNGLGFPKAYQSYGARWFFTN